jgi:hypothetical protein
LFVADERGLGRLRAGASLVGIESMFTAWSILLFVIGLPALDFSFFGVWVASHPAPLVVNDVALSLAVAVLLVLPVALFAVSAWIRSDGGRNTRIVVIAGVLWVALDAALVVLGGAVAPLVCQVVFLAVIASGARARRRPLPSSA